MKATFKKGVHPSGHKELSKGAPIGEMPVPKRLYFNLAQHIGAPAQPVVEKGDRVKVGTLLAKEGSFVSANLFCSVSGTVLGIEDRITADGSKRPHLVVENDYKDETETLPPLKDPTREEILERIRTCGIVGMGGAGFPTAVKLQPKNAVDTLIINAAECEPYITCDYRVMLEYTERFVNGVLLLKKALGDVRCVIGIEDNKPDAIERLEWYLGDKKIDGVSVVPCRTKYPQGAEKQLIFAVTGRKVPATGLPADVGCIVQNVHTALSVYYAVTEGQPLFRRVMTVTGHGIAKPANLWVRIGTPVSEIVSYCGLAVTPEAIEAADKRVEEAEAAYAADPKNAEFKKELCAAEKERDEKHDASVAKLINGGPMMGLAMASDAVASTKTMSCVLVMTERDVRQAEPSPCINCGKCVSACPMNLMPNFIDLCTVAGDFEGAKKYGAPYCIACGCCAFVCPAKRPLLQHIAYSKNVIKERNL